MNVKTIKSILGEVALSMVFLYAVFSCAYTGMAIGKAVVRYLA